MKMSSAEFLVIVLLLVVTCSFAELATEFAEASGGSTATLPCSIAGTDVPDKISNILWYRGDEESPIYKYEVRGTHIQHWTGPSLQNRYFLRINKNQAFLTISPTKNSDEGIFHCRVDFQTSPTKITHINLTVIEPPASIQVSDSIGPVKKDITEAYAEGASISLTCTATGGKPLASVSWWRNQTLVSEETEYFPERAKSQSILKIDKLTRSHLLAVYSCEANNSKRQPPLVVRVAVDMYLRPLEVILVGNNSQLSTRKKYNITCKTRGSRPPAIISWWKDGRTLEGGLLSVSADGNTTTSIFQFTPEASDHGLTLACKAANQRIPFSEIQRTWMLKVLYPPKVVMTLGHGLDGGNINEGADVYFECHIISNPWIHRVWWLRDGARLLSNGTAGVIVSNQTLVLQGVTRSSSGHYACEAANEEGTSTSPAFDLRVKFEPICKEGGTKKIVGTAKGEPVDVECKVEAEPPAIEYRWSFNSTPAISRDLTKESKEGGTNILTYIPHEAADYGTLQCWGRNDIGWQRMPCTYHMVPAGKPDPPQRCEVTNITHHSVFLSCRKGFDGGMKQKFVLVLYSGELSVANISALNSPEFDILNLEPAQEYYASIYSFNSKGTSKYTQPILIRTLPAPGLKELRRTTEPTEGPRTGMSGPWLYILLAAGSTFIVAAAVGLIVFVVRRFRIESPIRHPPIGRVKHEDRSPRPLVQLIMTDNIPEDDNNPDLIPPAYESLIDSSSLPPYTITARPQSKRNCATQMPVKPYHVTWAPILQSRNCSTQTPPPHKESSV